ncbi:hypothetical protein EMPS_07571 [Entomortierella parvispora]|uniref:Uncharacterized protein n=1 Tax=Entomortierella parvispora TaxID=205924 RepID=A0A9P3HF61_9FUNG|nr:hypothetical protein EMPS_07571 [Entomortierella parvispora]
MSSPDSDHQPLDQPSDQPIDAPSQSSFIYSLASRDPPSAASSSSPSQGPDPIGTEVPPLGGASSDPIHGPNVPDNEATAGSDSSSVNSDSPKCLSPRRTHQGQRRRPAISAPLSPLLEESPARHSSPSSSRRASRGSPVHTQRVVYTCSSTSSHSSPRQAPSNAEPYPPPQFRSARSQSAATRAEATAAAEARQSFHESPSIHPHSTPPLPQPPLPRSSSEGLRNPTPPPRPLPPYELRVNLLSYDQVEDLFHEQFHQYYKPIFEQLRREMQYLQGKFDIMGETMLDNRRILDRLNTLHDTYAQNNAGVQNDAYQANQHGSQLGNHYQYNSGYSYNDPGSAGYNDLSSVSYNYDYNYNNQINANSSPTHSDQNHSYHYYDSDEENGELNSRNS